MLLIDIIFKLESVTSLYTMRNVEGFFSNYQT